MKIETKFNIGDNVYYLELGSEFVRDSAISKIEIYNGFKKPYEVCYMLSKYDGEKNIDNLVAEENCFKTEEEAIATLIKYHKVQARRHKAHLDWLDKHKGKWPELKKEKGEQK